MQIVYLVLKYAPMGAGLSSTLHMQSLHRGAEASGDAAVVAADTAISVWPHHPAHPTRTQAHLCLNPTPALDLKPKSNSNNKTVNALANAKHTLRRRRQQQTR